MPLQNPITLKETLSLPTPTESQCETFITHLANAHSWYKHLPLFGGGKFVVFLDRLAGRGYPLEYPRLPDNCTPKGYPKPNTVTAYREAFGYLNYIYQTAPKLAFNSDGNRELASYHGNFEESILEGELFKLGHFILYPYISDEFFWCVHEKAVTEIRAGKYHPHAKLILKAFDAELEQEAAWQTLSDAEQDTDEDSLEGRETLSPAVLEYWAKRDNYYKLMAELRNLEIHKLREVVFRVRRWHVEHTMYKN